VDTGDGASAALTANGNVRITINGVNDAPTSAGNGATTAEDAAYTFKVSDFPFSDVDSGDSLKAVRIDSLPSGSVGTLAVNGNVLTNDTDADSGDTQTVVTFTAEGTTHSAGSTITLANGAVLNVSPAGAVTLTQNGAYEYLRDGEAANVAFSYTMEDAVHAQS